MSKEIKSFKLVPNGRAEENLMCKIIKQNSIKVNWVTDNICFVSTSKIKLIELNLDSFIQE